jgi:hypothetical protein
MHQTFPLPAALAVMSSPFEVSHCSAAISPTQPVSESVPAVSAESTLTVTLSDNNTILRCQLCPSQPWILTPSSLILRAATANLGDGGQNELPHLFGRVTPVQPCNITWQPMLGDLGPLSVRVAYSH